MEGVEVRKLEQDQIDENIDMNIQCDEEFKCENDLQSHFETVHKSNIETDSKVQSDDKVCEVDQHDETWQIFCGLGILALCKKYVNLCWV